MKLSIITTLYQSAPYLTEFCARAATAAQQLADNDYEIILVNDGSPDESLQLAINLSEQNRKITVIDLSRNFGHHKAMMTGLAHGRGKYIFLIDSDLEEEPEWVLNFNKYMQDNPCDVVYGIQASRKGKLFEKISGKIFYRMIRYLTGLNLPENCVTARLMSRQYVKALLRHEEREVFIAGLWHITGFNQQPLVVNKHSTSTTTYTLKNKIALFVNSITSFTNAPLTAMFYLGCSIFFGASLYTLYLLINRLFLSKPLSGWTSIMASIWLLGGLLLSFLGIIGIYLSKIYSETKQRPYTIVNKIYGKHYE